MRRAKKLRLVNLGRACGYQNCNGIVDVLFDVQELEVVNEGAVAAWQQGEGLREGVD